MEANKLLDSYKLGPHTLSNRIVMSPMTRSRTTQPGDVPNAMMAKYYAQRASSGNLIISEATQVSPQGKGYSFTPGIFSPEQIAGWKLITNAVHSEGGHIFLQLWHVGRMSHESFHADGIPVAPSALSPEARVWIVNEQTGEGEMLDCPVPRELSRDEIKDVINDFRRGAANAIEAGFDGVEIHGGNGYLIDQFLRKSSNHRKDEYGRTIENRVRFLLEVTDAVADEVGPEKTGIRLAPFIKQRGMDDPQVVDAILYAAGKLDKTGLVYIHLSEADWDDAPVIPEDFRKKLREVYNGTIIVAGKYDVERSEKILADKMADLVAFGRSYIANPDLPFRFAYEHELADFDDTKLFGGDKTGFCDYPGHEQNIKWSKRFG